LSIKESRAPTPDREELFPLNPMKDHHQRKVTMPREDKNKNGKRNPVTQIIGKKAKNLSKKKAKSEKLQEARGRTSQNEDFQNLNFVGISEQCGMELRHGRSI
jgi:hypothetical protein